MAKTVVILGAGASRCLGTPLMWDFREKALNLSESQLDSRSKSHFDAFRELLLDRLQRLYARSNVQLGNIENVFNLVEMGTLIRKLPDTPADEIAALAESMRYVLAKTVEQTSNFPQKGGTIRAPAPYATLVGPLKEKPARARDVAFLTMNYDLAIDVALHHIGAQVTYEIDADHDVPTGVPVLKLHGSLHWATCPRCQQIAAYPLEPLLTRQRFTDAHNPHVMQVLEHLPVWEHGCGTYLSDAPVIVPPSWNKTSRYEALGRVWQRAAAELATAENVIVIGYSLPRTDSFFQELLALGLAGTSRLRSFVVVDPDPEPQKQIERRFRRLIGPEVRDHFSMFRGTFERFATEQLKPGSHPLA
jgi:hypothetical protein